MTRRRSHSGPFQRAARRVSRRLPQHTIAAGVLVSAIAALMAWVAWSSVNGVPLQKRYRLSAIVPAGSPIIKTGDAVRASGRLAGIVQKVEPYKGNRRVEMLIRPAFTPVGRDARTRVTVKSLIYLTYLELFPGNAKDPLPSGSTIALERSSYGTALLQVVELFDRQSRRTLNRAVYNGGLVLAGRGRGINQALADLPAIAKYGPRQLRALTSQPGTIGRSLRGAAALARGLAGERPDDAGASLASAAAVTGALAARNRELGATLELLRPFEDRFLATAPLADPLLDRTISLVRTVTPALRKLSGALPDLNRALSQSETLKRETHRLTTFLRPVLGAAIPVVVGLRDTVAAVDPLVVGLEALAAGVQPYAGDIALTGRNLVSVTTKRYFEGLTPDNPALRFTPVFNRAACRNPYPAPGTATHNSGTC